MAAEAEAEEGRWEAEPEVMEVEMGVGGAMEDGEIEGGVDQEEEEEEDKAEGNGDGRMAEEDGVGDRKVWRKRKNKQQQQEQQPRTPIVAESRASWRGKVGKGIGRGFHHRPWILQQYMLNRFNRPGVYGGAIIICNHMLKREFFQKKLFGLPGYATSFIKKIRAGMLLFVFEHEERKLYGVFEANSDGSLNNLTNPFTSLRKPRPAQVHFRRVWFCKPLVEIEFSSAIKGNCLQPQMSFFGISYQQVLNLVDLFASKRIGLQPYQKPKSRVIWDYKISLAHPGREFSPHTRNMTSSRSPPIFCKNRFSFPHSCFMQTKQNAKHGACKYESPLYVPLKSVIFKAPDVKGESLEPNADYIPLELDDCKSDSDADLSDGLETIGFYSTLEGCISLENQDLKPFNGNFIGDGGHNSHVLIPGLNSECGTGRNSVLSHIMKERQSILQARGGKRCKRKAILEFDEHSSPRRCTMKKVSFSFSGEEISVTSEKSLHRPEFMELDSRREASTEEGKPEVGCLVQKTWSKGEDVSAKVKLMSLSLPEGIADHVHSCSSNSRSLVTQTGIKLTYTVLTDKE